MCGRPCTSTSCISPRGTIKTSARALPRRAEKPAQPATYFAAVISRGRPPLRHSSSQFKNIKLFEEAPGGEGGKLSRERRREGKGERFDRPAFFCNRAGFSALRENLSFRKENQRAVVLVWKFDFRRFIRHGSYLVAEYGSRIL